MKISKVLFWVFGGVLPWLRFNKIYLNYDKSPTDCDGDFNSYKRGPYYVNALCFEWLNMTFPFPAQLRDSDTDEPVFN